MMIIWILLTCPRDNFHMMVLQDSERHCFQWLRLKLMSSIVVSRDSDIPAAQLACCNLLVLLRSKKRKTKFHYMAPLIFYNPNLSTAVITMEDFACAVEGSIRNLGIPNG